MLASRFRWSSIACSTGLASRPLPALLKCTTFSQPGVSARSAATSRSGTEGRRKVLSSVVMKNDSSIHHVATSLRAEVSRLAAGDRLTSSRDLVRRLGVSPVTGARAIGLLAAGGAGGAPPGSGTFVAPRRPPPDGSGADTAWQAIALGDRSVDARRVTDLLSQ